MLSWTIDALDGGHVHHFELRWNGERFSVRDVLGLWLRNEDFREQYLGLLRECPFAAFRWETPALTRATVDQAFEFVLVDDRSLERPPDEASFADHYDADENRSGIVSFENLGGDALLVVPVPHAEPGVYTHLQAFVHGAPATQQHNLWQAVADRVRQRIGNSPLWLSTAGGGVAWLHVRLDSYPKYYSYRPYTREPD